MLVPLVGYREGMMQRPLRIREGRRDLDFEGPSPPGAKRGAKVGLTHERATRPQGRSSGRSSKLPPGLARHLRSTYSLNRQYEPSATNR